MNSFALFFTFVLSYNISDTRLSNLGLCIICTMKWWINQIPFKLSKLLKWKATKMMASFETQTIGVVSGHQP